MTNDDLLLLQTSVFTGITTDEIRDMLSCLSARETTFIKDEIIFSYGETITGIGIVLEGSVHIVKEDFWGNANLMAECVPGDIFGEAYARAIRREADADRSVELQTAGEIGSELTQWPVQIKLAPVRAPYFDGAKLLIAADCSAYAYGDFHRKFIRSHVTLIGCPKLDDVDYSEKLTEIIKNNDIKSVTITRMEVPCCGGIEMAAKKALQNSGKFIPWQVVTISTDGRILG